MLRSFKWKIAFFSLVTSGLILIAFALLFLTMIRRIGLERIDRQLTSVAASQLRRPPFMRDWSRFESSLSAMYDEAKPQPFIIWVLDREGRTVYTSDRWPAPLTETRLGLEEYRSRLPEPRDRGGPLSPARFRHGAPLEDEPPPDARDPFPDHADAPGWRLPPPKPDDEPLLPRHISNPPAYLTVAAEGKPWRIILLASDNATVAIGMDLTDFRSEIRRHWRNFALAGPLALFLLAAGGWLLAEQALRPVRILTQVADGITAKGLSRRVQSPGADREFQALIDVINGMLDRLEKSFLQAARFSADAAHELKTPLTILQGQLEQAVQAAPSASREQQRYADLLEEVQRLKGIVRKLLLLAQSDSGQLRLSHETVCLTDEVESLLEDLPLLAPGLTVEPQLAPGITVSADPDLLRQVLQNLFSNAAKYNRADGRIVCRLFKESGRAILVLANTTDGETRIDREQLFDRFYRGDPSHTRKVDGNGLGLSLAREISRAHGGELTLDRSENREGWIAFRLELPAPENAG